MSFSDWAGKGYALEVMRVQEVLDVPALTEVPGSPKCSPGRDQPARTRGAGLRLADSLRPEGDAKPARAPSVLIVETEPGNESQVTGLLVDRVSDVLEFSPEEVQPSPQLGLGKTTPYVRGLIRHQEGFLLVLDVDRVFSALSSLNGGGV